MGYSLSSSGQIPMILDRTSFEGRHIWNVIGITSWAWSLAVEEFCRETEIRSSLGDNYNGKEFRKYYRWMDEHGNSNVIGFVDKKRAEFEKKKKTQEFKIAEPEIVNAMAQGVLFDSPKDRIAGLEKELVWGTLSFKLESELARLREAERKSKREKERVRKEVALGRKALSYFNLIQADKAGKNRSYEWKITDRGNKFLMNFMLNVRSLKVKNPGD